MTKKEILGEFYLGDYVEDIKASKIEIINVINKFINKYKEYNPLYFSDNKINDSFTSFALKNDYNILNESYFTFGFEENIRGNGYYNYRYNDVCLMVDKNSIKHVFLLRRGNHNVIELNPNLGKSTLISLYFSLVYDVEDLKKHLRLIKEIQSEVDNKFKNKFFIKKINENRISVIQYKDFVFNKKDFELIATCNIFKFDYSYFSEGIEPISTIKQTYKRLINILNFFNYHSKNYEVILESKEELINYINNMYEERYKVSVLSKNTIIDNVTKYNFF